MSYDRSNVKKLARFLALEEFFAKPDAQANSSSQDYVREFAAHHYGRARRFLDAAFKPESPK